MAAINPSILVRDLDPITGSISDQTVTNITDMSVTWKLGGLEDISYGVQGDGIPILRPDTPRSGPRRLDLALEGTWNDDHTVLTPGDKIARMFSYQPTVSYEEPITLTETGVGSADALATAPIDRQTAQQITLADALYGARGSVTTTSGNLPLPSSVLPRFEGIGRTKLGLAGVGDAFYRYEFKVDPSVSGKVLDVDVNRDYVLRSLDEILSRLPAATDPEHSQYVIDSSDHGVLGGGPSIAVGFKGATPHLTFDGASEGDVPCPVLRGTRYSPSYSSLYARADFRGGDTHHGAPEGGQITSLVTVGTGNGMDNAQDTCVVSFYTTSGAGGCYVWQAGGRLLLISQAFGVHDQWYNPADGGALYAATDTGIYARTADLSSSATYARMGTRGLRCIKVMADSTGVYALASGNQAGQNGIIQFTDGTGPDSLGGWVMKQPNDHIIDFAVISGAGIILYLTKDNRTRLVRLDSDGTTTYLPIASGSQNGIGIDPLVFGGSIIGIALRTSAGAAGLYLLTGLGTSMSAITGLPANIAINKLYWHNPQSSSSTINGGVDCQILAATSNGLWYRGASGSWHRADGQSNLGDLNLLYVADDSPWSPDGTLECWPVYAANGSQLYVSYDGMLHFVDVFSEQLSGGPAFYDLVVAATGAWPSVTDTSVTYGSYTVERDLNGLNHWYYTDVNAGSIAVGGAQRNAELAQISTPSQVPEGGVSRQLLDADDRFLAIASSPQTICVIESFYEDTSNPLHTLRPGHQVRVHATLEQVVVGDIGTQTFVDVDDTMYVLEQTLTFSASEPGTVRARTRVGMRLLNDAQDPAKMTADNLYVASRQQIYKSKGRH